MVTISPLLSALVAQAVSSHINLKLLAEFRGRERLADHLRPLDPEFVVIGLDPGEDDAIGASLLQPLPRAKILLISNDGNYAYIHERRVHRSVLFDFSPENLNTALFEASDPANE